MDAEVFPLSWVTRIAVKVVTAGIIDRLGHDRLHANARTPKFPAPLLAHPADPVRRKWLRCADLRNRLVSAFAAGDRLLGGFARSFAGDLYGRDVPGQYPAAEEDFGAASSAARLRL